MTKSKVIFIVKLIKSSKTIWMSVKLKSFFFQLDDGGQYRCTARNERGEVNLIMNLDVAADISVGKHNQPTIYFIFV